MTTVSFAKWQDEWPDEWTNKWRVTPRITTGLGLLHGMTQSTAQQGEQFHAQDLPGTLAKGLAGAHFGEKDQITWKNKAVV